MSGKYPYQLIRDNIDKTKAYIDRDLIIDEFREIINRHSLENDSNTPDFILAEYLWDCLMSANIIICSRTIWYNPPKENNIPEQQIASTVNYLPCERYTEHVFVNDKCFMCGKTSAEVIAENDNATEQVSTDRRPEEETGE